MKILLVEPNILLGDTYRQALETEGYKAILVHGAQEAVQVADNKPPDVVVLELQLAGHSGVEFLYEFRSYPEWQQIPIVLHTMVPPHALNMSEALLNQLNIADYLYKPSTSLHKLCDTIAQIPVTMGV
jgi:DNA-binding response OmpR family regulator